MLGGSDIKKMAAGLLHHHHSSHYPSPSSSHASLVTPESIKQERQFVARFSDQKCVLPPDEIQQDPRNKELGRSSKSLTVRDFELVRTLGTGAFFPRPQFSAEGTADGHRCVFTGTFARVWLVRLANAAEEDRDKVYALKVLRKAESAWSRAGLGGGADTG
jgi:protein kinase A